MGKVKSIHEDQYIISDNTADLGFKYDNNEDEYIYKFPVLRYEKRLFFVVKLKRTQIQIKYRLM